MPSHTYSRRDHITTTSDIINRTQDKSSLSPVTPAVTGIIYPSPVEGPTEAESSRHRPTSRIYVHPNIGGLSDDIAEPPPDAQSLDQLWENIRQEKERKMAKERPKIQSLEEANNELSVEHPQVDIPVMESQASVPKSLKKQKSMSSFRESTDGRSIVATFEMPPEVCKQDIHVSFQRNRLILTWETVEVTEWEEDGCLMRERLEQMFHRTLPLPEGTRFEEIHGVMNGRRLVLRYPNMRCFRVDGRSRSGES